MTALRIAVATRCFDQPLRQALSTASGTGASGVQFDARNELRPADLSATGRRELLHRLSELQLRPASVSFPVRRPLADANGLEARVGGIKAAMQFAWELNAPIVCVRPGRAPQDLSSAEGRLLADVLNDLARHGNRVGATLCLTPTRESADALLNVVDSVTEGPVGIDFDPAAFVTAGFDATAAFQRLHARVAHFTVRDALRDVDGGGVEVPVGRGEVVWDELLATLDEAGYAGWQT
ncbi:MAG TPA: sugar phosphate isomerase/epimerase family protein, partial [Planctomycetaceae bacterium]|nr:sugar phosphate isomerase/epimerase family protein [Planctomycetaceae bacterium]